MTRFVTPKENVLYQWYQEVLWLGEVCASGVGGGRPLARRVAHVDDRRSVATSEAAAHGPLAAIATSDWFVCDGVDGGTQLDRDAWQLVEVFHRLQLARLANDSVGAAAFGSICRPYRREPGVRRFEMDTYNG